MLALHGARLPPDVPACRGGRAPRHGDDARDRGRSTRRLGGRLCRVRRARGSDRRRPRGHLRHLPPLPGVLHVISSLLRTPRPVPGRLVPASAGALVIALALPVYAIGGWRLGGWGLAAVLWVASELFGLLLARLPLSVGNLARAGMVAFGMLFRAIAVCVILV